MITIPQHRAQGGDGEVVVAVEDPDHDARQSEDEHERKEDACKHGCDLAVLVSRPEAEDRHHPRSDHDEERGQASEADQHEPEERRGDSPGALSLPLDQQIAEDGDERRRERGVGDERSDRVRNQERDLEGVDRAADAEDRGLRDLPHQPDDARDAGGDREDDARAREPAADLLVLLFTRGGDRSGGRERCRLPFRVERLRLELDELVAVAAGADDRRRPLGGILRIGQESSVASLSKYVGLPSSRRRRSRASRRSCRCRSASSTRAA